MTLARTGILILAVYALSRRLKEHRKTRVGRVRGVLADNRGEQRRRVR